MTDNNRVVLTAALAMAGVAVLAYGGFSLAEDTNGMSPLRIANVAVLAALIRFSKLRRDAVIIGAAAGLFCASLLSSKDLGTAAALTAGNVIEIVFGLVLFTRFHVRAQPIHSARNIGTFILTAGVAAPVFSSVIGAGYIALTTSNEFWSVALHRYAADALGMIVLGPLILAVGCDDDVSIFRSPRRFELLGVALGATVVTFLVFNQSTYPTLFLILPLLIVAVFRLRFIGTALGITVVAIVASAGTLTGNGPIAAAFAEQSGSIIFLQAFLAVTVIATVPFAAILVERKSTIQTLIENYRLLQMAEKMGGVGHWRLNADNQDLFWSDEVCRIHGHEPGFIPILSDAIQYYHIDDRDAVQRHVDAALLEGKNWTMRARIVQPCGEIRYVQSSGQAETAPDGRVTGVIGVFCDVTDAVVADAALVESRDEARAAAEAKSAFLATMSHEIRTPMTGVLGMIELLRTDLAPDERERFFDNLDQSASLLMTVLDDVLDFSKLESSSLVLEHIDFDLVDLAQNTIEMFRFAASKKGLLLAFPTPVGPTILRGDPTRLQQVMANLISNAIKFTTEGKIELRLKINDIGGKCTVLGEVADTGIGISADAVDGLFEPFVQADASTTRRFGGTGLGLAISKRLVEAMDGNIEVESIENVGTTFRFEVTLETGSNIVRNSPRTTVAPTRTLSILLAEDNQINRALVEAVVRHNGHSIRSVENGLLAVEAAMGEQFDVILMDMQMPIMDGLAATRAIRGGDGPCANIPIIALTADASAERRRFYDNVGLTEFLTKPIDSGMLIEHLNMIGATGTPVNLAHLERANSSFHVLNVKKIDENQQALGVANSNRLMDMLRDELCTRPQIIRQLIEADARTECAKQAHALMGAAINVGANLVGEIARCIEAKCESDDQLSTLGDILIAAANATVIALDERNTQMISA